MAEKLSEYTIRSLHFCCEASVVCNLLDFGGRGPLLLFCPTFATAPLTYSHCLRSLNDDALLLSSSIQLNSLDLFRRNFLGAIVDIWAPTSLDIRLLKRDGLLF